MRRMGHTSASHSRRGFTLMELAIVLGVVGLLLAAIWVAASRASETANINQAVQELQELSQGILSYMAGQRFPAAYGNYTSIVPTLITNGTAPSWAVISPTAIEHPWGMSGPFGGISLGVWAVPPVANPYSTFQISFYGIPTDACIGIIVNALACQAGTTGCPISFYTAYLGSGYQLPLNNSWSNITPATATALCQLNGLPSSGHNSLEFLYGL
jgi:prepilin-type N-terminal cleavage/methylation domain-containing protein